MGHQTSRGETGPSKSTHWLCDCWGEAEFCENINQPSCLPPGSKNAAQARERSSRRELHPPFRPSFFTSSIDPPPSHHFSSSGRDRLTGSHKSNYFKCSGRRHYGGPPQPRRTMVVTTGTSLLNCFPPRSCRTFGSFYRFLAWHGFRAVVRLDSFVCVSFRFVS